MAEKAIGPPVRRGRQIVLVALADRDLLWCAFGDALTTEPLGTGCKGHSTFAHGHRLMVARTRADENSDSAPTQLGLSSPISSQSIPKSPLPKYHTITAYSRKDNDVRTFHIARRDPRSQRHRRGIHRH